MARERLTTRVAEDLTVKGSGDTKESKGSGIANDPYELNDTGHGANDPKREQYAKGDPEKWAEGVNTANPAADDDKREETGHAPLIDKHAAMEAVASAKKLEEKAIRCIVAAQRMLPGAPDDMIELQAADLMHLPEPALNATLTRQEKLAGLISKAASDSAEESKEASKDSCDKPEEKKEEAKEATKVEEKKEEAKEATKVEEKKEEAKEATKAEEKKEEAKEATKVEEKKEEAKEATKAEEKEEAKEASDNLLDMIFSEVIASDVKKGATSLSGLVKKEASEAGVDLSSVWASAPDISDVFGKSN